MSDRYFISTLVLFLLLCVASLMAIGFAQDADKHFDDYVRIRHDRDRLLVKYERYRWLGDEIIAVHPSEK